MFKQLLTSCLICLYAITALGGVNVKAMEKETLTIPLLQYDNIGLSSQHIQSTSAGLMLKRGWGSFTGLYTRHDFNQPLRYDFPGTYHSIDALVDTQFGSHQYLGIYKSDSDQLFNSDKSTYQAAAVYGFELIHDEHLSLVLGGGIAVGEFRLDQSNDSSRTVIPVPLVRANYQSGNIEVKFEFLTSPNLSFTLWPGNTIRITGDFRADQFRDTRDLIFETNLEYRFNANQKMAHVAGVSLGLKNDNVGAFALADKPHDETLEAHYHSLFATIDMSVIKISVGRSFDGRLLYREKIKHDVGNGHFISVQGFLPL